MKKHLSKRLLSLLLAVALLFTSAPIVAYATNYANLEEAVSAAYDDDTRYLFAYFSSNSTYGQQIRLAVSEDGLNYTTLNYNRPIIAHSSDITFEQAKEADAVEVNTQYASGDYDSSTGYSRDPYIFASQDGSKYYMVATDMDASEGDWSGDTCFVIFESEDLINWTQISVFSAEDLGVFECTDGTTRDFGDTIRAWAPEVIYDEDEEAYLFYWSNFFGDWYESVFGVYLNEDLTGFADDSAIYEMYHTSSGAAIDADIVEYDGTYYMFYKDESEAEIGCVTSDTLTGSYSDYKDVTEGVSSVAVEGCQVYQIGDSEYYVLMMDEYNNGTFVFGITNDLENLDFTALDTDTYSLSGFSPRHGSVIQISVAEYEALLEAYTYSAEAGTIEYGFATEASYSASGWLYETATDSYGHTFDAYISTSTTSTVFGTTTVPYVQTGQDGSTSLDLYCAQVAINDPDVEEYLLSQNFTVTFDYTKKANSVTVNDTEVYSFEDRPIFAICQADSNLDTYIAILQGEDNNVYLLVKGSSSDITVQAMSNNTAVQQLEGSTVSYTLTYDGTTVKLYMDYVEVASAEYSASNTGYPTGSTIFAALGFDDTSYGASPGIYGSYENLTFYDTAFDTTEAKLDMPLVLEDLDTCMSAFESLITSGNIYTNYTEAYQYYKEAQRLIVVRDYGDGTVDDDALQALMDECAANLKEAIESMSLWTGNYTTQNRYTSYMGQVQYESNVLVADGEGITANQNTEGAWEMDESDIASGIAYTDSSTTGYYEIRFRNSGSAPSVAMSVYGDSYIAIYDGTNSTQFPLKMSWYKDSYTWSSRYRGLNQVYLNNNNLSLITQEDGLLYLSGVDSNSVKIDYMWPTTYSFTVGTADATDGFTTTDGNKYHYYGFMIAQLNDDAFDEDEYLLTIDPNLVIVDQDGNEFSFGNSGKVSSLADGRSITDEDGSNTIDISEVGLLAEGNAATYYVINVEPIIESLEKGAEALMSIDIDSLSETDMLAIFEAADALTSFDPYTWITEQSAYNSSTGYVDTDAMEDLATDLADVVEALVEDFDAVYKVTTIDEDGYTSLYAVRNDTYISNEYFNGDADSYTENTWSAFKEAYETAIAKINELVTVPFENELNKDGTENTTISEIVANVYITYYGLRQRADLTGINEVTTEEMNTKKSAGNGSSYVDQVYSYNTWYNFVTAYENVQTFIEENQESMTPMYAATETTMTVNGYTFTVMLENTEEYSDEMKLAWDYCVALVDAYAALEAPACYEAYDAAVELISYQDLGAFKDPESSTLYTLLKAQGTNADTVTFSVNGSIDIDTPEYAGTETAYIVDEYGVVWKNVSENNQETLDVTIQTLLEELTKINTEDTDERATYTVTYTVMDGEEEVYSDEITGYYGETYTVYVPEGYEYAYKWVVTANGDNTTSLPASDSYTAYITSDIEIVAYVSATDDESELITLQILNLYGNLVQEYYVDADTVITVDKNYLAIDDTELTSDNFSWLADTPFYTFDGWQVNGANYNNGTTFTLSDVDDGSGVVTLKIKMNVTSGTYTISLDRSPLFNCVYDEEVTVSPGTSSVGSQEVYGLAIMINNTYYAVSYGIDAYTFYAVGNADLYTIYKNTNDDGTVYYSINNQTVTDTEAIRMLNNRLPFSYSIGQLTDEGNVFTVYSAYTANLPEGAEVTEVGTLYIVDNEEIGTSEEAFVLDNEAVSHIAAKNPNATTMQYYLRLSGCSGKNVYTRSYVKYSYTTSDGTVIQSVYYGNIVSNVDAD